MKNFVKFSKEVNDYDLGDGYRLQKDNSEDMAKDYAVYEQLQNYNSFFRKNFKLPKFEDDNNMFRIMKDDIKIGGVYIEPNYITDLFLIPPYNNEIEVLERLKEILFYWSDETKDIKATVINKERRYSFEKVGFENYESNCFMIRPTKEFDIEFGEKFYIDTPKKENISQMAAVIVEAQDNNPVLGPSDFNETERWLKEEYFEENPYADLLNKSSTVVYDKETKEMVGLCLMSLWQEWPLIVEISVKPSYEGRGLGTNMIKKALSILKDEFPVVRLYVNMENKAQRLYHNLGFLKGADRIEMKLKK